MVQENKKSKQESRKLLKKSRYESNTKTDEVRTTSKNKKRKGVSNITADEQKSIFILSLDPYEKPLKWWETDHIKYAINYKPVKLRVEALMASPVVHLTDREYMMLLMENIQYDHRDKQLIRIEERKEWAKTAFALPPTSISTVKCL